MRPRRLILAAIVTGTVALSAIALDVACSRGGSSAPSSGGLGQLEQDTGVQWVAVSNNVFGTTSYLAPKSTPPVTLTPGTSPTAAALAFFVKYGAIFQMTDPAHELTPEDSGTAQGLQFASFTQSEGAASVYGTRLTMVFDSRGHIAFVSGLYVPNVYGFATHAALAPDQAAGKAQADMATRYAASQLVSLEATPAPMLTIYPLSASPTLAYSMTVSYASDAATDTIARQRVVMLYVVDATSGAILQAVSGLESQYAGTNVVQTTGGGQGEAQQGPAPARTFTVLGTGSGGGDASAPYYLQVNGPLDIGGELVEPKFVRTPSSTPVLKSSSATSWDNSGPNAGSAVDAYFFLGEADRWWQQHGRNGYDNHAAQLGILVHDSAGGLNQAFWDSVSTIHVTPSSVDPQAQRPLERVAPSVDFAVLGHEFQHAVTQTSLGLVPANVGNLAIGTKVDGGLYPVGFMGQSGSINESLSDVFGEFMSHDLPPNDANCVFGHVWVPGDGVRNMVDPQRTLPDTGPQPDSMDDKRYWPPTDTSWDHGGVHRNSGVPNKAWSLMTFGGQDNTKPYIKVSPSLALGWEDSETLYVSLIQIRGIAPIANFKDLGYALTSLATAVAFASGQTDATSTQETAVACAWYAVGVFSKEDMTTSVGIDPCTCAHGPDAGTCDAGTDAGHDAAPPTETVSCLWSDDAGTNMECHLWAGVPASSAGTFCSVMGLPRVPSCPNPGQIIGCCNPPALGTQGSAAAGVACYYQCSPTDLGDPCPLLDGGAPDYAGFLAAGKAECALVSRSTWTAWPPPMPGGDAGADAGGDAGKQDASPDSGGDSAPPPHC